jgi:hypothetical protein
MECEDSSLANTRLFREDLCSTPGMVDLSENDRDRRSFLRYNLLRYNLLVPDVKPFRLTESVKAAG